MRLLFLGLGLVSLAACSLSSPPDGMASLTLNDPYWDRVNVEVVLTRSADCDTRGEGYISTQELSMAKNKTETVRAPNGANVCWRHDRDPNNPSKGAWSSWTKAVLNPGQSAESDL
ncbi:MAG TPA: hypothetical protein VHW90_07260 [Stellaceae bacterium]|nr:hypothetical protein [Stellaceae bacterium]